MQCDGLSIPDIEGFMHTVCSCILNTEPKHNMDTKNLPSTIPLHSTFITIVCLRFMGHRQQQLM